MYILIICSKSVTKSVFYTRYLDYSQDSENREGDWRKKGEGSDFQERELKPTAERELGVDAVDVLSSTEKVQAGQGGKRSMVGALREWGSR